MAMIRTLTARFALLALLGAALAGGPPPAARAAEAISEQDAHAIGVTAYTYLYSLVTMDVTRKQLTNVAKAEGISAPMNTFANVAGIPDGGHEGRGPAELRHAVFQRLARPDQGADDRLGPRHAWALLPAADARHVDRRVRLARLAHDRNPGRRLCRGAAGLERVVAGGRGSHRRADALCLDHRPHQDRRPGRLRRRPRDPGGLQDHAAVALGQGGRAGGRHRRSGRRHEDAAEDRGREDAGRRVLRLRRRDPQAAAAPHHRSTDPRPDAADRDRAGQELRHRQGRSGDQGRARDGARGRPEADGVEGPQPRPRRRTAGR